MKQLRNLVCAFFLTIILTFSAIAGEIQNPGAVPEPTPTPTESSVPSDSTESQLAGEIQNPGFTATMLDILASVLALF
jgi:hypothetical protein